VLLSVYERDIFCDHPFVEFYFVVSFPSVVGSTVRRTVGDSIINLHNGWARDYYFVRNLYGFTKWRPSPKSVTYLHFRPATLPINPKLVCFVSLELVGNFFFLLYIGRPIDAPRIPHQRIRQRSSGPECAVIDEMLAHEQKLKMILSRYQGTR